MLRVHNEDDKHAKQQNDEDDNYEILLSAKISDSIIGLKQKFSKWPLFLNVFVTQDFKQSSMSIEHEQNKHEIKHRDEDDKHAIKQNDEDYKACTSS